MDEKWSQALQVNSMLLLWFVTPIVRVYPCMPITVRAYEVIIAVVVLDLLVWVFALLVTTELVLLVTPVAWRCRGTVLLAGVFHGFTFT